LHTGVVVVEEAVVVVDVAVVEVTEVVEMLVVVVELVSMQLSHNTGQRAVTPAPKMTCVQKLASNPHSSTGSGKPLHTMVVVVLLLIVVVVVLTVEVVAEIEVVVEDAVVDEIDVVVEDAVVDEIDVVVEDTVVDEIDVVVEDKVVVVTLVVVEDTVVDVPDVVVKVVSVRVVVVLETFSVWTQYTVREPVRGVSTREECHWSHACKSFKRSNHAKLNGTLECKFLSETPTRTVLWSKSRSL
jgi:hypothetical protein